MGKYIFGWTSRSFFLDTYPQAYPLIASFSAENFLTTRVSERKAKPSGLDLTTRHMISTTLFKWQTSSLTGTGGLRSSRVDSYGMCNIIIDDFCSPDRRLLIFWHATARFPRESASTSSFAFAVRGWPSLDCIVSFGVSGDAWVWEVWSKEAVLVELRELEQVYLHLGKCDA